MKKIKECLPFILALIIFCTAKIFAQVPCTFTTCSPFGNNDLRQIFGATSNNGLNQTITNNTLTIIKQKQDTIAQSHRILQNLNTIQNNTLTSIFNRIDTASRYITVTYTWTSPSTFTPIIGNWATSSTNAMTTFSVSIPNGTWKITNVTLINSIFMPLYFYVFDTPIVIGANNTLNNATVANLSNCIGIIDGISSLTGAPLNGYFGSYNSLQIFKPIAVRNAIYFAATYRATTVNNNAPYYVKFTLEK